VARRIPKDTNILPMDIEEIIEDEIGLTASIDALDQELRQKAEEELDRLGRVCEQD